eukprot:m.192614 g.192614  ORF g.192614 m.192614 type:complete len:413 (+) comp21743_c0_seq1:1553-2791(+)
MSQLPPVSLSGFAGFDAPSPDLSAFELWPMQMPNDAGMGLGTLTLHGGSSSHPASVISGDDSSSITSDNAKFCSICGRSSLESKIGHRLQGCSLTDHSQCALVCNCCEDFFRRQCKSAAPLERCEGGELCAKEQRKMCRWHRFTRCKEVGMHLKENRGPSTPLDGSGMDSEFAAVPQLPSVTVNWMDAINNYTDEEVLHKALRDALQVDETRDVRMLLHGGFEFSDLQHYDLGDDLSVIYHEQKTVRALVQPFFAPHQTLFELPYNSDTVQQGVPVGLLPVFVASNAVEIGRELIPVKLDSKRVPLDPICYTEMRNLIPRRVCVITRSESTKTPLYQRGKRKKERAVEFRVTSKCENTTLYIRRADMERLDPIQQDQTVPLRDGDYLSILNEDAEMAELFSWRVTFSGTLIK